MNERQKKRMDILEKFGEDQEKKRNKKHKKESLSDIGERIRNLLIQEMQQLKEPEKELTAAEVDRLKDACLKMREDSVETLNVSMSLNAFIISIFSLIVSVMTAALSGQEGNL